MDTLREYLKVNRILQADFAAQLGVTQSMVSRIAAGQQEPSLKLAAQIERLTGGAVRATSLVIPDQSPTPTREEDAA